jgi:hypothetical protein
MFASFLKKRPKVWARSARLSPQTLQTLPPGKAFRFPSKRFASLRVRISTRSALQKTPSTASRVGTRKPPARLAPEKISIARLPVTGSDVFGREEDIAFLDRAWANKSVNVVILAKLRDPRIHASPETIAKALEGNWRLEHLFVLGQALQSWKQVQEQLVQCDQKLEELSRLLEGKIDLENNPLAPSAKYAGKLPKTNNKPQGAWRQELYRHFGVDLTEVPGLSLGIVQTLFVEMGPDLSAFPTAGHYAAWLGLCPNNDITGGKVIRRSTGRNRQRIRVALRLAASSLHRSKTHLGECFRRLRARLGSPKAITAMAHKLARIIWHLISHRVSYDQSIFALREEELLRRKQRQLRNLAHSLGFALVPQPLAAATSSAQVS